MIPDAPHPVARVVSTAYCLRGTMADGSYTRHGSVASNKHALHRRIRLRPRGRRLFGRRTFTIRDRIGWGTELDFWTASCATARAYGVRRVHYVVLKTR